MGTKPGSGVRGCFMPLFQVLAQPLLAAAVLVCLPRALRKHKPAQCMLGIVVWYPMSHTGIPEVRATVAPTSGQHIQSIWDVEQRQPLPEQLLVGSEQLVCRGLQVPCVCCCIVQDTVDLDYLAQRWQLASVVDESCCTQELLSGTVDKLQQLAGPADAETQQWSLNMRGTRGCRLPL